MLVHVMKKVRIDLTTSWKQKDYGMTTINNIKIVNSNDLGNLGNIESFLSEDKRLLLDLKGYIPCDISRDYELIFITHEDVKECYFVDTESIVRDYLETYHNMTLTNEIAKVVVNNEKN